MALIDQTPSPAPRPDIFGGQPPDAPIPWPLKKRFAWVLGISIALAMLALIWRSLAPHPSVHHPWGAPPMWGVGTLPFVALLGAIAVLPLIPFTHHWWESNFHRLLVALFLAALTIVYFGLAMGFSSIEPMLQHALVDEYVPFMMLLFSLYVICGGINLSGDLPARPAVNTGFLAVGTLIASFVGTTGASLLLIRPLLQTNSERRYVTHTVVFFIFLVSNIGGSLLPIGDPPLLLGYLRGVPFTWTLRLIPEWAVCSAALLVIYYFWDRAAYRRERIADVRADETIRQPLRIRGSINLLYLMGVVFAVWHLVPGSFVPGTSIKVFPFMRELTMLLLVVLSLLTSPRGVRQANAFNYVAITEVAVIFLGIFITMQVPVMVLQAHGHQLGLSQPWQFFWVTGALSSFLDNAPTYIVFFETANSMSTEATPGTLRLLTGAHIREDLLVGISLGAVFMGAMTYIGNGPNFMVRSIAQQSGVRMPSFFGFLFRYSIPILVPLFIVMSIIFVRSH